MLRFIQNAALVTVSLSCFLPAQAHKAHNICLQGMIGCGVAFETPIEPVPTLTTATTGQTSYTIINQGDSTVNIALSLQELDSLSDSGAVTFDETTTCPISGTLDSTATCEIVLDFQPTVAGDLSWTLTVTPSGSSTSQLPLVLPLQTTVTGVTYPLAIAGGDYTPDGTNNYPLLAVSTNGGSSWDYVIDASTTPLPYQLDATAGNFLVETSCATSYCVAGGAYTTTGSVQYPFGISNNGGDTWSYSFDGSNIQSFVTDDGLDYQTGGVFTASECINDVCMLGGSYVDSANHQYPLLVTSVSGGDWALSISATMNAPSDMNSSPSTQILGTSCTGSNCVMVGQYENTDSVNVPMLAYTTDNGSTWTYPTLSMPSDFDGGGLNSVSCNGNICAAAGFYYATSVVYQSFVAWMSFDQGVTWSLMVDSSSAAVPSLSDSVDIGVGLGEISCSDTACAMAGFYNPPDDSNTYPYMAVTVFSDEFPCTNADNCNWVIAVDSTTNVLSDLGTFNNSYNSFNGVVCSETTCVGPGDYNSSTDGNEYPFIATFQLSDATVTYPVDQSSISASIAADDTPPDYGLTDGYTYLEAANCSGTFCTAAGQYVSAANLSNSYPFLMTSDDSGSTWSYSIDGNAETLPSSFTSGGFNGDSIDQP